MAISKLNFNSLNVTPSANSAIGFDSGADDLETGAGGGSMVFIKKLTATSGTATMSFVNGASSVVLDSTYKEYVFIFNNIHPSSDTGSNDFQFNMSVDTGSNYNASKTTTAFYAFHPESDSNSGLSYDVNFDLGNGTGFQDIAPNVGGGNDEAGSGILHLYNPSSTTFVKHFTCRSIVHEIDSRAFDTYTAGYANTTSAVDAVRFQMSDTNIDAGTITLYGIN